MSEPRMKEDEDTFDFLAPYISSPSLKSGASTPGNIPFNPSIPSQSPAPSVSPNLSSPNNSINNTINNNNSANGAVNKAPGAFDLKVLNGKEIMHSMHSDVGYQPTLIPKVEPNTTLNEGLATTTIVQLPMALPVPVNPMNPSASPNSPGATSTSPINTINPTSPPINPTSPNRPSSPSNTSITQAQQSLFSSMPNSPPQHLHSQHLQPQPQPAGIPIQQGVHYQPFNQHMQHAPLMGNDPMGSFPNSLLAKRSLGELAVDDRQDLKRSKADADRVRAFNPDYRSPFVDLQDVHLRLACYHIFSAKPEAEGEAAEQLLKQAQSLMSQLDVLHQQIQTAAVAWSDGGLYREDLAVLERLAFYDEKTETDALKLQYNNAQVALSRTGRTPTVTSTSPSLPSSPSTPLTTSTPSLIPLPAASLTPSLVPTLAPSLASSLTSSSTSPFTAPFGQQFQPPYSPSTNTTAATVGYLQAHAPPPSPGRAHLPLNSIPSPTSTTFQPSPVHVAELGIDTSTNATLERDGDLGVNLDGDINVDLDTDLDAEDLKADLDAKAEGNSDHSNGNHITDLDNVMEDPSEIEHDAALGSVLEGIESGLSSIDDIEAGIKEESTDKNDQREPTSPTGGYYEVAENTDYVDGSTNNGPDLTEHSEIEQEKGAETHEPNQDPSSQSQQANSAIPNFPINPQPLLQESPSSLPSHSPQLNSPPTQGQPQASTSPRAPYMSPHPPSTQTSSPPSPPSSPPSPKPQATESQQSPHEHLHSPHLQTPPQPKPHNFSPQTTSDPTLNETNTKQATTSTEQSSPSNSSSTNYSDDSETNR